MTQASKLVLIDVELAQLDQVSGGGRVIFFAGEPDRAAQFAARFGGELSTATDGSLVVTK